MGTKGALEQQANIHEAEQIFLLKQGGTAGNYSSL